MLNTKGARLVAGARTLSRNSTRRAVNATQRRNGARGVAVPLSTHRGILQSMFYSSERVIEYRSGKSKEHQPRSLYRSENETENCGVGLVASLKSVPSRKVVEQADEMLVRMSHRGGCGCDPASGDGAGKNKLELLVVIVHTSMHVYIYILSNRISGIEHLSIYQYVNQYINQ